MMQELFVGVDVSKDWLDIHHPNHRPYRIANSPAAARQLARSCLREGAWIIFEATGGYDRVLHDTLEAAGAQFSPSIRGRRATSLGLWA